MKKRVKRIISMLIVAVMMVSMLSVNVMATEGINNGAYYERNNMESSSCIDYESAGKIRAIMLNSYPNVDLKIVGQNSGIADLTVAEAISAAKIALYQYTQGIDINVDAAYEECQDTETAELVGNYLAWFQEETGEDVSGNDPAKDAVKEKIQKVSAYFSSLDSVPARNQLVTLASFTDYSQAPEVTVNEDGTYNVTVTATVDVVLKGTDAMTLSAVMGNGTYKAEAPLVSGQNTVTITNIPENLAYTEIKLAIDGTQTVDKDVFLFTAKDEETTDRAFLRIDSGRLPVHAEVTVIPPMEISLKKTAVIKEQGADGQVTEKTAPLEGIAFDVYRLDDANAEIYVTTLTTDVSGGDVCNLTSLGQQPGTFKIVEKEHPAITSPSEPVQVTLPYTSADGVNVYRTELAFENTINDAIYIAPQVRNDITNSENNLDSFAIGEMHTWIIRGDIPVDIAVGKEYVITDTLDYRLSYAGNANVKVKVGRRDDIAGISDVVLTAGEHYTVTSALEEVAVSDTMVEPVTSFEVRLTPAGMNAVAGVVGNGAFSDYEVRVYFKAVMDEDATPGVVIPNQAALHYTNCVNYHFTTYADSQDIPGVYTCSLTVYKHDAADNQIPLSGVTFKLVRVATEKDAAEVIKPLVVEGNTINVVYESFFTKPELTADDYAAGKSYTATTDEKGFAYFNGLKEGDYYLIETKASGGYHLLDEPIPVSVGVSAARQVPCLVKYVAGSSTFELPPTGGIGTLIFTVGGAVLIGAAIVILLLNKKKENKEDEEE